MVLLDIVETIRLNCTMCHKDILLLLDKHTKEIELHKNCNCTMTITEDFLKELLSYFVEEPEETSVVVTDEVIEFIIPSWLSTSEKEKLRKDLENIYNSLLEFFRGKK